MKKLILLIVLITNFCIFNVSYSEAGNTHTGQDAITAGTPLLGQLKYCLNLSTASSKSKCPPGVDGRNINQGYIDCSGFSRWVYGQLGVDIGWTTSDQQDKISNAGCKMSKDYSKIKPGDLAYYPQNKKKGYGHVVIATGNTKPGYIEVIQSSSRKGTNKDWIPIKSLTGYYSAECVIAKMPKWNSPPYTGTVGSEVVDEGTSSTVSYKGGALGLDAIQKKMIDTLSKNFVKYQNTLLYLLMSILVIEFLRGLLMILLDGNKEDSILTHLTKSAFNIVFAVWVVKSWETILGWVWDLINGLGSAVGGFGALSLDHIWDLFMSGVVIKITNTLTGKAYSSFWAWANNFNAMLSSSILWIIFLMAVITLAIIIIAQLFAIQLEFFLLGLVSLLYFVIGQLEPFANFKMKVVSLLVSLGVKFFVLTATITTTIKVISNLEVLPGDVGGALTGIASLSLCLVIIFHVQTMVQVMINGRGLEGGAMEMVNNGASKLIKYLTGNFF